MKHSHRTPQVSPPEEFPTFLLAPIVFTVTVEGDLQGASWKLQKRYSDFDRLHTELLRFSGLLGFKTLGVELPPKLPPPGRDLAKLELRAAGLSTWATRVLREAECARVPAVVDFFELDVPRTPPLVVPTSDSAPFTSPVRAFPAGFSPSSAEAKAEEEANAFREEAREKPATGIRASQLLIGFGVVCMLAAITLAYHGGARSELSSLTDITASARAWASAGYDAAVVRATIGHDAVGIMVIQMKEKIHHLLIAAATTIAATACPDLSNVCSFLGSAPTAFATASRTTKVQSEKATQAGPKKNWNLKGMVGGVMRRIGRVSKSIGGKRKRVRSN
jgi:hypothetical protein